MFCTKCGAEISDGTIICPKCGCATSNFRKDNNPPSGFIKKIKPFNQKPLNVSTIIVSMIAILLYCYYFCNCLKNRNINLLSESSTSNLVSIVLNLLYVVVFSIAVILIVTKKNNEKRDISIICAYLFLSFCTQLQSISYALKNKNNFGFGAFLAVDCIPLLLTVFEFFVVIITIKKNTVSMAALIPFILYCFNCIIHNSFTLVTIPKYLISTLILSFCDTTLSLVVIIIFMIRIVQIRHDHKYTMQNQNDSSVLPVIAESEAGYSKN